MKKSTHTLYLLPLVLLSFFSCTKEDSLLATDNSQVLVATSIELINDLDLKTGNEISLEKQKTKKTSKFIINSCTTITEATSKDSFPKTFVVDFGSECITNGIKRSGKLKITFSDYTTQNGSTMIIERDNYSVNGNKIKGTIEYKNTTINSKTPQWARTVTNGEYMDSKGDIYLNSGTHTVKQTAGITTITLNDDTYEMVEGIHTVSKQNGGTITLKVSESLIKIQNCDYISKGKLNVENSLIKGTINYGNGECDNKATYTQNGIEFPFSM